MPTTTGRLGLFSPQRVRSALRDPQHNGSSDPVQNQRYYAELQRQYPHENPVFLLSTYVKAHPHDAKAAFYLSRLHEQQEQWSQTIQYSEQGLIMQPEAIKERARLVRAYLRLAQEKERSEALDSALKHLDLIKSTPGSATVYRHLLIEFDLHAAARHSTQKNSENAEIYCNNAAAAIISELQELRETRTLTWREEHYEETFAFFSSLGLRANLLASSQPLLLALLANLFYQAPWSGEITLQDALPRTFSSPDTITVDFSPVTLSRLALLATEIKYLDLLLQHQLSIGRWSEAKISLRIYQGKNARLVSIYAPWAQLYHARQRVYEQLLPAVSEKEATHWQQRLTQLLEESFCVPLPASQAPPRLLEDQMSIANAAYNGRLLLNLYLSSRVTSKSQKSAVTSVCRSLTMVDYHLLQDRGAPLPLVADLLQYYTDHRIKTRKIATLWMAKIFGRALTFPAEYRELERPVYDALEKILRDMGETLARLPTSRKHLASLPVRAYHCNAEQIQFWNLALRLNGSGAKGKSSIYLSESRVPFDEEDIRRFLSLQSRSRLPSSSLDRASVGEDASFSFYTGKEEEDDDDAPLNESTSGMFSLEDQPDHDSPLKETESRIPVEPSEVPSVPLTSDAQPVTSRHWLQQKLSLLKQLQQSYQSDRDSPLAPADSEPSAPSPDAIPRHLEEEEGDDDSESSQQLSSSLKSVLASSESERTELQTRIQELERALKRTKREATAQINAVETRFQQLRAALHESEERLTADHAQSDSLLSTVDSLNERVSQLEEEKNALTLQLCAIAVTTSSHTPFRGSLDSFNPQSLPLPLRESFEDLLRNAPPPQPVETKSEEVDTLLQLGEQNSTLELELKQLTDQLASKSQEATQLQQQLGDNTQSLNQATNRLGKMEQAFKVAQEQLRTVDEERDDLAAMVDSLKKENASLKEQLMQARENGELQAKLQELRDKLKHLEGTVLPQLLQDKSNLKDRLQQEDAHTQQLCDLQAQLDQAKHELEQERTRRLEADQSVQELALAQQRIQELTSELDERSSSLHDAKVQVDQLQEQLDDVQASQSQQASQESRALRDLQAQLEEANAQVDTLTTSLEESRAQLQSTQAADDSKATDLETQLADATTELAKEKALREQAEQLQSQLEQSVTDAKSQQETTASELSQSREHLTTLEEKVQTLTDKLADAQAQLEAQESREEDDASQVTELNAQLSQATTDLEQERALREQAEQAMEQYEQAVEEEKSRQETVAQELAAANERIEVLEEQLDALQQEQADVKAQAQVDDGLEEQLQQVTAELAKEKDAREQATNQLEQLQAQLTQATNEENTRQEAADRELSQTRERITTLEEELHSLKDQLADAQAQLQASQEDASRVEEEEESKVHALEEQVRTLTADLENEKEQQVQVNNQLTSAQEQVQALTAQLEAAQESQAEASSQEIEQLTKQLQEAIEERDQEKQAREALDQSLADLTATQERVDTLTTQVNELTASLDQETSRHGTATQELAQAQERIQILEEQLHTLTKERDEAKAQSASLDAQEEKLTALDAQLTQTTKNYEDEKTLREQAEQRQQELEQAVADAKKEQEALTASLQQVQDQLAQAPSVEQYDATSKQLAALQEELTDARDQWKEAEQRASCVHDLESQLQQAKEHAQEAQEKIDSLTTQANESSQQVTALQAQVKSLQEQGEHAQQSEEALQQAQEQVQTLSTRLDQATQDLEQRQQDLVAKEEEMSRLQKEQDQEREQLQRQIDQATQAQEDTRAQMEERADVTPADLEALREDLARLQDSKSTWEQESSEHQQQVDALATEKADLVQEVDRLKEQLHALQTQEPPQERSLDEPHDSTAPPEHLPPIRMKDIHGELLYKIMAEFNTADQDGNQEIDFEEFKACFRNLDNSHHATDEELELLFKQADTNESGDLNFKEFCGAYLQFCHPDKQ